MKKILVIVVLAFVLSAVISAEERTMAMDMFLIIDNSSAFREQKSDALAWINEYVIDRILTEGDNITVLAAGDSAESVFSGSIGGEDGISSEKDAIKGRILALETNGSTPDFAGALRDAQSQASRISSARLTYIMLITASASGLEPVLAGNSGLLRWSRSLRYDGWQVFIVAPDIGPRVREAAQAYMNSRR